MKSMKAVCQLVTHSRAHIKIGVSTSCTKLQQWEPVIGLEIHAQISSTTKLFSGAESVYAAPTNSQVAHLDASLPGTLPRLNLECVKAGVLTALALQSSINHVSRFDRKHYFYADLPTGYQITQQRQPIARGGRVHYLVPHASAQTFEEKVARITQLQLEQDSGKSLHDSSGAEESLIDLNRAGTALMEIVTEPDFRSADEAAAFVKQLKDILVLIGTCECKMQEGNLRVDASVSLHKPGEPLGVRSEVKNINSIKHVSMAIGYEIKRQRQLLDAGKSIESETRSFDSKLNKTIVMRDKEKLHDYRFMSEPNLPPLRLYTNLTLPKGLGADQVVNIDDVAETLPELPHEQRERLSAITGIRSTDVIQMAATPGMTQFFDETNGSAREEDAIRMCASLVSHVALVLHTLDMSFLNSPLLPSHVTQLRDLVLDGRLTRSTAKAIIRQLCSEKFATVEDVINCNNLWRITDAQEIQQLCEREIVNFSISNQKLKRAMKSRNRTFASFTRKLKDNTHGRIDAETLTTTLERLISQLE